MNCIRAMKGVSELTINLRPPFRVWVKLAEENLIYRQSDLLEYRVIKTNSEGADVEIDLDDLAGNMDLSLDDIHYLGSDELMDWLYSLSVQLMEHRQEFSPREVFPLKDRRIENAYIKVSDLFSVTRPAPPEIFPRDSRVIAWQDFAPVFRYVPTFGVLQGEFLARFNPQTGRIALSKEERRVAFGLLAPLFGIAPEHSETNKLKGDVYV